MQKFTAILSIKKLKTMKYLSVLIFMLILFIAYGQKADSGSKQQTEKHSLEQQDSLKGVYIPKDIKDCFITLDSILSEEDKETIKKLTNKNETIQYHHGFGTWLRNNWGLWGGSRLQKYFLDRKVNHPDSMSSLILEYYYDWLHGKNEDWEKFDKKLGKTQR